MTEDDDTIRRAKEGDAAAWHELYTAHAGRLVMWLHALPSGDPSLTPDDLSAEAWLTAASKIADFHGTKDEFAGWLFGIARNQAKNARRRSQRRATSPSEPVVLASIGPAVAPDVELETGSWIAWVLSHLPERERQVVACLEVVGLDVAATATALGMSATAVRVARHRGLRRLRALDVQSGPVLNAAY